LIEAAGSEVILVSSFNDDFNERSQVRDFLLITTGFGGAKR